MPTRKPADPQHAHDLTYAINSSVLGTERSTICGRRERRARRARQSVEEPPQGSCAALALRNVAFHASHESGARRSFQWAKSHKIVEMPPDDGAGAEIYPWVDPFAGRH